MSITFNCPRCSKSFTVKDSLAGEKGTCKQCGESIRIPGSQLQPVVAQPTRLPAVSNPHITAGTQIPGEFTIWQSSSSQIENFGTFLFYGILTVILLVAGTQFALLLILVIVPVTYILMKWLQTKCKTYELTNQRLRISSGVLSRNTEDIELFRIKDTKLEQPIFIRLFGRGNVIVVSADMTQPMLMIEAVPKANELRETLRAHINEQRKMKMVREMEIV